MHEISLETLQKYIRYEPETGDFYWIAQPNPRGPDIIGAKVGCLNGLGYWQIRFAKRHYYGHRLAWLFTHGYMPKYIDHKNGKPWDNRLCNLRECTHSQNHGNYKRRNNGIELHGAKYRVRIVKDGVRHEFGSYNTLQEADVIADAAYDKLFGEYAYASSN